MIFPRVTPEIEMRFVRLFSPATILPAAIGTFKQSANSRRSDSFARFSNAGAVSRTFKASPYAPSIAFRLPRGITRTAKITPPSRSIISITSWPLVHQKAQCRRGSPWLLLRSQSQSRGSCPSKAPAVVGLSAELNGREARATLKNMAARSRARPEKAGWSSIRAIVNAQAWRHLLLEPANPIPPRHFWRLHRSTLLQLTLAVVYRAPQP